MRKFKFLSVILAFMVFLGSFTGCNPNTSSQEPAPTHTCESVCETCGKCTDTACTETACADKCQGHHTCESVCETCGKCTDAACTETVCADKCGGHTVTPGHTCESVCVICGKCTDAACTETACTNKCGGHHTCESVCVTCGKCTDAACTEEACKDKCGGHIHTCESVCEACRKCKDTTCTEEACKDKCLQNTGYVDVICKTCGMCSDETCTGVACEGKCPGHGEYSKYINYQKDVFKDKEALFIGDSICEAICEKDEEIRGWSGRIQYSTKMQCTNLGLSGAAISTTGPTTPTKRILAQYISHKSRHFDFVIMQGGVNDAWAEAAVGNISTSFDVKDFDTSTYAGGLEELFYNVTQNHSNAKLGYIFTFSAPYFTTGRIENMTEYYDMAKKICAKWKIPFLNMYEDEKLNEELKVKTKENLSDYLHPNSGGYDVLYKYIMYWMETLPVYSEIKEGYKLETMASDVLPRIDVGCSGIWTKFY